MNEIERLGSRLESDLLRTFLAVAERRNLTHAARVLGRTQSAISVQIRKLEAALSVSLFAREARGMSLTQDGELLLAAAAPLIRDLDRVGRLFADPLRGRVRVGVPDDYGTGVLESILADFGALHPDVEIAVRCGISIGFPEAIARDELDLAVYACDPAEKLGQPILTEQIQWVASRSWQPREPVPLALFDRACWWRDAAVDALEAAGKPFSVAVTSESAAGVKAAVGAGLAVGILARSTVEPNLQVLGPRQGFPKLPTSIVSLLRSSTADGAAADAMDAAIRDGFRKAVDTGQTGRRRA